MAQNFDDYDELLKIFEDEPVRKTDSTDKTSSAGRASSASSQRKTSPHFTADAHKAESDAFKEERRKKVNDFNLKIKTAENEEPKHRGVYFSNPPKSLGDTADIPKSVKNPASQRKASAPPASESQKKVIAAKERRKKKRSQRINKLKPGKLKNFKLSRFFICVAIVAFFSTILCFYGIGCINDVFALHTSTTPVEITVSEGATDNQVISLLKKNKLIKHSGFCKFFIKLIHITDSEKYEGGTYVSGIYTLSSDMGLEKMLSTLQSDITLSDTVSLTFPEGWTVDQIAEKLQSNEVCSAASFINTIRSVDFSDEYEFIADLDSKEDRFRLLEGYIYPDTYDFYVGENASSVVRRFLDNFKAKWEDSYKEAAQKAGMNMDDIITLASILQKEAADTTQMSTISSIIYNRLESDNFQWLQCDSTETYLTKTIKPTLTSSTEDTEKYIGYRDHYDTYSTECHGLPIGPICNPGDSAIKAALKPKDTNYYYSRHDNDVNVYYAATFAEHEQNAQYVEESDD